MSENTEIRKGLNGVVADVSAISKVNSETNSLLYRGYPVPELAATQSFEAVAYLLWNGELPTADQLSEAIAHERSHRALDEQVRTRSEERKSTRLNSSHVAISYAVFCLKKKKSRTTLLHLTTSACYAL